MKHKISEVGKMKDQTYKSIPCNTNRMTYNAYGRYMLENLDKIDWSSINHCYGPATDLPDLIRGLIAEDKDTNSDSMDKLFISICHQGTVYEATAYAVPFLFELVNDHLVRQRDFILALLGSIASGQSYYAVHNPAKIEEVEREMVWVRSAREEVRKHHEITIRLLEDKDVFLFAAYVLAGFKEDAARLVPAIDCTLEKVTELHSRICLGLVLAILGDYRPEVFESNMSSDNRIMRLKTFAGLAADGKIDINSALDVLLDIIDSLDNLDVEWLDELVEWQGQDT